MAKPSEEESVPRPNTGSEASPAPQPGSSVKPVSDLPATTSAAAPIASSEPGHGSGNIPLEADEGETTDDASSLDERLSSYTASLTSSVVDYPEEYGRRYHAFRSGSYVLPNDDTEAERLDMAHALMTRVIGNKLFLAPIDPNKLHRILDIGTGTGIWAIEAGDLFPNAEVIGNDLSAIQPTWVPPNVKFEIDDVESPWVGQKYDYIMCRYMAASIGDWPKLVKNVYDHLNPGGWAEFQDMSVEYYSDDDSYKPEHATWDWNKTFVKTLKSIGRDPCPGPQLEGWVRGNGGFEQITHRKFKVPIGPWPKHQPYKDLGLLNLAQILEGLEGFTLKLFCGVLGKSKEEVQVQLARVRNELKGNAFHSLFDIHVVYGQKPL